MVDHCRPGRTLDSFGLRPAHQCDIVEETNQSIQSDHSPKQLTNLSSDLRLPKIKRLRNIKKKKPRERGRERGGEGDGQGRTRRIITKNKRTNMKMIHPFPKPLPLNGNPGSSKPVIHVNAVDIHCCSLRGSIAYIAKGDDETLGGFRFDVACCGAVFGMDGACVFGEGGAGVSVVDRSYEAIVDGHF